MIKKTEKRNPEGGAKIIAEKKKTSSQERGAKTCRVYTQGAIYQALERKKSGKRM